MKIIIIGGLTNGKILIDYFLKKKNITIELLITYPENHKISRYKKLDRLIKNYKLKSIYDLNANKYYNLIKNIKPDIIFVIGWSGMIDLKIINLPKLGCIGFHPSKLPFNRGRSVLAWQIEEGETRSAYTAFFMTKKPDAGDLILQQNFKINKDDYINSILNKIDNSLIKMLPKIFFMIKKKKFIRIKQNLNKGSYRKLRDDSNSKISWNESAVNIYNKIRAISKPYPGAYYTQKKTKIRVWKSKIMPKKIYSFNKPGDVLKTYRNGDKIFMTNDKPILIYSNKNK